MENEEFISINALRGKHYTPNCFHSVEKNNFNKNRIPLIREKVYNFKRKKRFLKCIKSFFAIKTKIAERLPNIKDNFSNFMDDFFNFMDDFFISEEQEEFNGKDGKQRSYHHLSSFERKSEFKQRFNIYIFDKSCQLKEFCKNHYLIFIKKFLSNYEKFIILFNRHLKIILNINYKLDTSESNVQFEICNPLKINYNRRDIKQLFRPVIQKSINKFFYKTKFPIVREINDSNMFGFLGMKNYRNLMKIFKKKFFARMLIENLKYSFNKIYLYPLLIRRLCLLKI